MEKSLEISSSHDNFSHRQREEDSPLDIQYGLKFEELLRHFYGQVNNFSQSFIVPTTLKNPLDIFIESLSTLGITNPISNKTSTFIYNLVFIGQKWALAVNFAGYEGGQPSIIRFTIECVYTEPTFLSSLLDMLIKAGFIPEGERKENKTEITFCFPGTVGKIIRADKVFSSLLLQDIKDNYTPDVIVKASNLVNTLRTCTSGVVIINGPVGTGKSFLIRALLSEVKEERRAILCTPPLHFLSEAGLLAQATSAYEKSIVILEDLGDLVAVDNVSKYMNEISNLLNFTDGLLSLLSDTVVILTFNFNVSKISEAVLRPGRCLEHIVVNKLPYEQAKYLVPDKALAQREYSLAEIYSLKRSEVLQEDLPNIGFRSYSRLKRHSIPSEAIQYQVRKE